MKPKEDLYRLIKSLSRSEKRYFTLDAKKSGAKSSNYLELFKAVNGMKSYDEEKLDKGKFPNLSMDKAYLYEAILKSMRDYRSPKSKRAQLKQRIMDAKFLYERGLYDQCADRLSSAKALAGDLSDSIALLEINKEERRLVKERGFSLFADRFRDFVSENKRVIQRIEEEDFFLDKFDELIILFNSKFRFTKKHEIAEFIEKSKQKLWKEPESILGKLRFYQSNAFYFHLIGNGEESTEYFRKYAELWDENPILKQEEYFRYLKALANAIAFSFLSQKIDRVEFFLKKLEKEPSGNFHVENLKFRILITHKINFLLASGKIEKSHELESEVETGLETFNLRDSQRLTILIQTASMMMVCGDLERSKFWLKKIIDYKDLGTRRDIHRGARVLNLLISVVTDDYETVELLIRSYQRYFKKYFEDTEIVFELSLISILKTIIPYPFEKGQKKLLIDFHGEQFSKNSSGVSQQIFKGWLEHEKIIQEKT